MAILIVVFFVMRRDTRAEFGPAVALCPGPDAYGYTCEPGGGFAYIDATEDLFLYQDDGLLGVTLPFPFVYYGTTYTEVQIGTNGTVQFGAAGYAEYFNSCLQPAPVDYMGDLLAPYWDDLDVTYAGYVETAVSGEAPNRIFVIEWDHVPFFDSDLSDTITFEVQLFEANNDIVFLYQDVTAIASSRGRSATVGIQSAAQGLSLQYSCNQPSLVDAAAVHFPHPAEPNGDMGLATAVTVTDLPTLQAKGATAEILAQLNNRQPDALRLLQTDWRTQQPARLLDWQEVDLTGNGRHELLLFWHGVQNQATTQLAVIGLDTAGEFTPLFDQRLSTRTQTVQDIALADTADLTGDGVLDALLYDAAQGDLFVLTAVSGTLALVPVPEQCQGHMAVLDGDGDGLLDIVRDGCATSGRVVMGWDGSAFVQKRP
ncbi:MAG: hypothetical protein KC413_01235 [Anaerolineales bacterium]|nr:hypothetical protein [Anaerolineales bacterium]